jgi:uncharacterized Zn-binding protein involved in type VI secretion
MAAVAIAGGRSTGHGCFPPRPDIGPWATKTFVNGRPVQLTGRTGYGPIHNCGKSVHAMGKVVSGSSKTRIEGAPAARIGDKIACGDTVAKGSSNTFIA